MIKNYLKIAFRGFLRNRLFTTFNLVSLVIGLFVAYIAIGFIGFEYSYDTFHENSENTYRLARTYRTQDYSIVQFDNWRDTTSNAQVLLAQDLKEIPGITKAVQFITSENLEFVEWNGNRVQEKGFLTTNTPADFVSVFTWKTKFGSLNNFSNGVNKVILTESSAKRIFGANMTDGDTLIGQVITIGEETFTLAAVVEDVPLNSHFDFSIAINAPKINYWGRRMYLGLDENAVQSEIEAQINTSMATINPKITSDPLYKKHFLQPIEDIHFKSNILYETKAPGNYRYILILGFFALFIIVITLFNYANFTLAIKSKEGKSIGIKKAMGAKNGGVAFQFIVEGVLLALIALPILTVLIPLLIPTFNTLMGVSISDNIMSNTPTMLLLVGLAVLLGLLASLTPAIFLAKRDALTLFKENLSANRFQNFSIRKYLIISQFVILISISSISYFVLKQMDFIENKDVGFQKEGILYAYTSPENQDFFQEQLRQIPEIKNVGNGSSFGIESFNKLTYKLQESEAVFDDAQQLYLDGNALEMYDVKMILGSSVPDNATESTRRTIINRTAAEKFAKVKNVSMDALIGTTVITEPEYTSEDGQVGFPFVIGGVFEDINVFSLREKLEPYFITVSPGVRMDGMSIISYDPAKTQAVIAQINSLHGQLDEPYPLELEFLSENMAELYQQDRQTANLVFWLNIVAVILAVLGIVGITLFLIIARTKEIGIRKVLGASEFAIMKSTVREYIFFIGIALLISWPVAWFASNKWLSNFAYKIEIQQVIFLIIGVLTFIGTAFIVSMVSLKAARANPAKSLRTE